MTGKRRDVMDHVDSTLNMLLADMVDVQCDYSYLDAVRYVASIRRALAGLEEWAILDAIFDGGAHKTEVADALGVSRPTLENRWGARIRAERASRRSRRPRRRRSYRFERGMLVETESEDPR